MPKLKKIEFECKVITPMFLAGADQKRCELRTASLRGELRWWLRALLGATSIQSVSDLFKSESEVFGSVDQVSNVMIKMKVIKMNKEICPCKKATDLFKNQKNQTGGMRYLWYSTNLGLNNRPYFEPRTEFKVEFTSKNDEALKKAVCAFWILSICGGLGTRSRRGAGSFSAEIRHSDIEQNLLPQFKLTEGKSLEPFFAEQFKKIEQIFNGFSPSGVVEKDWASFSKVKIFRAGVDNANTWEDAVNKVGREFQEFRSKVPKGIKRAAFGLPLMYRSKQGNATVSLNLDDSDLNDSRRASPLWISFVKLPNDNHDAILTYFESKFLPDSAKLCIEANGRKEKIAKAPDLDIIGEFIDCFPKNEILLKR